MLGRFELTCLIRKCRLCSFRSYILEPKLKSALLECYLGRLLNFDRGYRFFLKAAFAFLVASTFLPFAFETMIHTTYSTAHDMPSRTLRDRSFYWSFMYVSVDVQISPDEPLGQPNVWTLWLFPPRYWEGPITSVRPNPLRSMFVLQIALLALGFFTVKQARRVRSLVPFFLGILVLDVLCFSIATTYYRTPSFGCWLLVVATLFIYIALIRAKTRSSEMPSRASL